MVRLVLRGDRLPLARDGDEEEQQEGGSKEAERVVHGNDDNPPLGQ